MYLENLKEILKLIENISPQAKDYVSKAFDNKRVEVVHFVLTEENKGVFLIVDNDDCCIFYASFLNESNIEQVLKIIEDKTNEYISKINSKEICFNVYGENSKVINLVRILGFNVDIEGFHLEYVGKDAPMINDCKMINKGFNSSMLKEFIDLFDSSYYQLNKDNGWEIDSHAIYAEEFHNKLNQLDKLNQVCSFWLDNELVGAYIFEKNYITDIVVRPSFQNKGYGSCMLAHCIRNMMTNKFVKNIRLRVTKLNVSAKRLYERNNFIEIACFAEHTYK